MPGAAPPRNPPTRRLSWAFYDDVLAEAEREGTTLEVEAELGRTDLFYLMCVLLRREDVDRDWLFDRCREVEQHRDGYLDLWAREHYKSTLITFGLTIQDILRDPEITVGIFSHTRPIAKGFLKQIKVEFETNDDLKTIYPDVLWSKPAKDAPSWSEDGGITVRRLGNPKEQTVEAWGLVDGQPTSKHFRLRIYDDVVTRESVTTPEQVQKTTDAWSLSGNLGVQADYGGAARHIGTRYSLSDTYAEIIRRGAAIPRVYAATHNGRMDGRPVFFSDGEWRKRLRDQSRTIVAAQLLQNPLADSDATFRTEWLRSYEVRPRTLNVYIMIDPSRGRSATSDNTAMSVVGVSKSGAKFFLDGHCHRMTLSERWVRMRELYKKWSNMPGVAHVGVGYERYGAQSDDEYFKEQQTKERLHFNIKELNWVRDSGQSKQERVERLEPDFRNSRFFLPLAVWHDGKPCVWDVDCDGESKTFGEIRFRAVSGLTRVQLQTVEAGSPDLIAKAIRSTNQDGQIYDVTEALMREYEQFPFGEKKDLIDATSRIYDMEIVRPSQYSQEDLTPPQYVDR